MNPNLVRILDLVSQGRSNAEIGALLFLSEETIKTYVKRILREMGARNRAHAVAIAFQRGILR